MNGVTPPSKCPTCGLDVVQIFLMPSHYVSYICDAQPKSLMEGVGEDIVIDQLGKVRRGRLLPDVARSEADEPFYILHTNSCKKQVAKLKKRREGK